MAEHLKIYGSIDLNISGRIEKLSVEQNLFIDTAHNKESIDSLVVALGKHFPKRKWDILFSVCDTKDVQYFDFSKTTQEVSDDG